MSTDDTAAQLRREMQLLFEREHKSMLQGLKGDIINVAVHAVSRAAAEVWRRNPNPISTSVAFSPVSSAAQKIQTSSSSSSSSSSLSSSFSNDSSENHDNRRFDRVNDKGNSNSNSNSNGNGNDDDVLALKQALQRANDERLALQNEKLKLNSMMMQMQQSTNNQEKTQFELLDRLNKLMEEKDRLAKKAVQAEKDAELAKTTLELALAAGNSKELLSLSLSQQGLIKPGSAANSHNNNNDSNNNVQNVSNFIGGYEGRSWTSRGRKYLESQFRSNGELSQTNTNTNINGMSNSNNGSDDDTDVTPVRGVSIAFPSTPNINNNANLGAGDAVPFVTSTQHVRRLESQLAQANKRIQGIEQSLQQSQSQAEAIQKQVVDGFSKKETKSALELATIEAAIQAARAKEMSANDNREKEAMKIQETLKQTIISERLNHEQRLQDMQRKQELFVKQQESELASMRNEKYMLETHIENLKVRHVESKQKEEMLRLMYERQSKELKAAQGEGFDEMKDFMSIIRRSFKGDYLNLCTNPIALHAMKKFQETDILFSDVVSKYSRQNQKQERILAVTPTGIYLFSDQIRLHFHARIPVSEVTNVSLSRLTAELIVIHHPNRDYMLCSPKRPEILFVLQKALKMSTGKSLNFQYTEKIYLHDEDKMLREVNVSHSEHFTVSSQQLVTGL
jgi:hypothetical protein